MKVTSAEFAKSAARPDQYPKDGRPEVAFAGRSNVGKSSLLNTLLHRKELARTSKKPGKTRLVNFFNVNDSVYFVDLPGYGFAQVSKSVRERWARLINSYVYDRPELKLACHLVDARHEPTRRDHDLLALLDDAEIPTLLVATKVDKLKSSEKARLTARLRRAFSLDEDALIVPYSSVTKEGLDELWGVIDELTLPRA